VFSTRDLNLAAVLITLKFELTGVDYQIEGDKGTPIGYFNFKNSNDLNNAENKYWSNSLAVEPRTFINNLRGLKARVTTVYKSPRTNFSNFKNNK
jgi:hypothetical protein